MTEDERRTAAIHKFYKAYRELQKYDNLRLHTHESIYDDTLIEAYRYHGEKKGECVLRVTRENDADAYEQAADQVKSLLERAKMKKKGAEHEDGQDITNRSSSHHRRFPTICTRGYANGAASYRRSG